MAPSADLHWPSGRGVVAPIPVPPPISVPPLIPVRCRANPGPAPHPRPLPRPFTSRTAALSPFVARDSVLRACAHSVGRSTMGAFRTLLEIASLHDQRLRHLADSTIPMPRARPVPNTVSNALFVKRSCIPMCHLFCRVCLALVSFYLFPQGSPAPPVRHHKPQPPPRPRMQAVGHANTAKSMRRGRPTTLRTAPWSKTTFNAPMDCQQTTLGTRVRRAPTIGAGVTERTFI